VVVAPVAHKVVVRNSYESHKNKKNRSLSGFFVRIGVA
jgi:hypothetical protein